MILREVSSGHRHARSIRLYDSSEQLIGVFFFVQFVLLAVRQTDKTGWPLVSFQRMPTVTASYRWPYLTINVDEGTADHGRRPRGRPTKRWLDNITEDCEELNLTIQQASRRHVSQTRVKWRNTVRNKGSRSAGTSSSLQRL